MATETENVLLQDANGNVLPQYWDATNSRYVVEANGDTSNVDFESTVLLTDPNGHVIPQYWDTVNNRWTAKTSSGGGSGGTGPQGPAGKDGKSAYQVALDNGFVGSEELWLESLVGPQGEPGEQGPPGADATLILPLSADDVADSSSKVLPTPEQIAQIGANTTDIASHSTRIKTVEDTIATISTTDERVKMNANGVASYLEDLIDGTTIAKENGKIAVPFLNAVTTTAEELNSLQGVTNNVQAQLNALSSVTGTKEVVDTELDLPSPVPTEGTVIVRSDSTQGGASTFYTSDGTNWVYVNTVGSDVGRDFTVDPLNIVTETTGVLPKARYELQNAAETAFVDSEGNIKALNTQDAIKELFQYAGNTKTAWASVVGLDLDKNNSAQEYRDATYALIVKLANNLVEKGVNAHPSNRLEEIIDKVLMIPNVTVAGNVKRLTKLNLTAPYELQIPLSDYLDVGNIVTTPIEFVPGESGIVHYNLDFDNGDVDDFEPNEYVEFDGVMKLRHLYDNEMTQDNTWADEGALYRRTVNPEDWTRIDKINVDRVTAMDLYGRHWFKFNEPSGNVLDSKGTAVGTVTGATRVLRDDGKGYMMNFNGSGQFVQFNSRIGPIGKKTFRFPIKVDVKPTTAYNVFNNTRSVAATHGDSITVRSNGSLAWSSVRAISGSHRFYFESDLDICDGEIHDVVLSWDGTTRENAVEMYIDGVLVNTTTALSIETVQATNNMVIGKVSSGTSDYYYFNGQLGELEVYNEALRPEDFPIDRQVILNDGEFKVYNSGWQTISTSVPTAEQFELSGMETLSALLDRVNDVSPLDELTGEYEVLTWSEDANSVPTLQKEAIPLDQTVFSKSDISLTSVEGIERITLVATGSPKVTISFGGGFTNLAYKNGAWTEVGSTSDGMTADELLAITPAQFAEVATGANFIRFNYYLSDGDEVDSIAIQVVLQGNEVILPTDAYDLDYDFQNKTIIYTFKRDMTVSVNYVDA